MRWHALVLALGLAACNQQDAKVPPPVTPDREAITYFGHMILVDHHGPKAQIHLKSQTIPLWFPAVSDAKAFTLLPGEPKDITAIYVTDMAVAKSWDHPGVWMPAAKASYVIGSDRRGGMGQREAVPFSDRAAAEAFAKQHGGRTVGWDAIPKSYVLGDSGTGPAMPPDMPMNMQMSDVPAQATPASDGAVPDGGGTGPAMSPDMPMSHAPGGAARARDGASPAQHGNHSS